MLQTAITRKRCSAYLGLLTAAALLVQHAEAVPGKTLTGSSMNQRLAGMEYAVVSVLSWLVMLMIMRRNLPGGRSLEDLAHTCLSAVRFLQSCICNTGFSLCLGLAISSPVGYFTHTTRCL